MKIKKNTKLNTSTNTWIIRSNQGSTMFSQVVNYEFVIEDK